MTHTHADPHLNVTTCPRCRAEWDVHMATDPLTIPGDHQASPGAVQPAAVRGSSGYEPGDATGRAGRIVVALVLLAAIAAITWRITR